MDGKVVIGTEIDTKEFDSQINYIERRMLDIEDKLKQADMGFEVGDTEKLEAEYERLGNQLIGLKAKQEKYNDSLKHLGKINLSEIRGQLNSIGSGIERITKKVVKWGLAVFSIRSAYRFVRQAVSELTSRNEQLATDIEYIRFALASTLAPVIEKIVQLAYKLLYYISYIAKAWFGINLFANATQKAFEGGNKSLKSSNKQAKQLQKTLAGFDEMNILQDNKSSSDDSGSGGGTITPSIDLSNIDKLKVPKWIQWIADNKETVLGFFITLGIIIGGLKLLEFISNLSKVGEAFETIEKVVKGLDFSVIIGVAIAIAGIVYAIKGIIDYLKDPTWNNFGKIIIGIGVAIAGVGIALGAWPVVLVGVAVAVFGIIVKYWDKIKAFFQKGIDWLKGKSDKIHEKFGDTIGGIYDIFVSFLQDGLDWLDAIFKMLKGTFDGIIMFIKGVFTGNWKMAWEGIKKIFSAQFEGLVNIVKAVFNTITKLFKAVGTKVGDAIGGAIKGAINGVLWLVEKQVNLFISMINGAISLINAIPGVNISKLSTLSLPRLAKGGIVNNPGPGVMMGNYIAGEAGAEAVLPLNDNTMDRLGESIARHMVINASITNTMNGRVISRELQKINNENSFAFNK